MLTLCRLADFGLSRVLDLDATHISTQSLGTVPYMPPELLSQGKLTKAADVYSLGILSASCRIVTLLLAAQTELFRGICRSIAACHRLVYAFMCNLLHSGTHRSYV